MKKLLLSLSLSVLIGQQVVAQNDDPQRSQLAQDRQGRYPKRIAQIGFVPPISTNGLESGKVSNRLSLNAIGSYAAALDGAEFSGIFSVE